MRPLVLAVELKLTKGPFCFQLQGRFVLITGQSATTAASCTQMPTPSLGYASMSSASPASLEHNQNQNDSQVPQRSADFDSDVVKNDNFKNSTADPTTSSKLVGPPRRPRLGRKDSSSQDRNSNRLSRLFNLRRSKSKDEPSTIVRGK